MDAAEAGGPARRFGCVLLVAALGFLGLLALTVWIRMSHGIEDWAGFLLVGVTLAALGLFCGILGWRRVRGSPITASNVRRLIGTALLLIAANFWSTGLQDSIQSLWPAAVLGAGGIAVFLRWTLPASRA